MRRSITARLVAWRQDAIYSIHEYEVTIVQGGQLSPTLCQAVVRHAHTLMTGHGDIQKVTIEFPQ